MNTTSTTNDTRDKIISEVQQLAIELATEKLDIQALIEKNMNYHNFKMNKANGFWDIKMSAEHHAKAKRALINTEIAEYLEAIRKGFPNPTKELVNEYKLSMKDIRDFYPLALKDTPIEELADIAIRALDYLGYDNSYSFTLLFKEDSYRLFTITDYHSPIYADDLTQCLYKPGRLVTNILQTAQFAMELMERQGFNASKIVLTKILYNSTRPFKHSKKF